MPVEIFPSAVLLSDYSSSCRRKQAGKKFCIAKQPASFDELVKLVRDHHHFFTWIRMPQIMSFVEFQGYYFNSQRVWTGYGGLNHLIHSHYLHPSRRHDDTIITRIVNAADLTGRRPLCAPDHFFHSEDDRKAILQDYFNKRRFILGIAWDLTESKETRLHKHPDFSKLKEWIMKNIMTGLWLFNPDRSDKVHWAREVVEMSHLKVCKEAVAICKEELNGIVLGAPESVRRGLFYGKVWSLKDRMRIIEAARQIWDTWRTSAEEELEAMPRRPRILTVLDEIEALGAQSRVDSCRT